MGGGGEVEGGGEVGGGKVGGGEGGEVKKGGRRVNMHKYGLTQVSSNSKLMLYTVAPPLGLT